MKTLLAGIWAIYIILSVHYNHRYIIQGRYINHTLQATIRVALAGVLAYLFKDYVVWYWSLLFMLFSYWFIFDTSLNAVRGLSIIYVGKTSVLDRMQRGFPAIWWYVKLMLFIAFTGQLFFQGHCTWFMLDNGLCN